LEEILLPPSLDSSGIACEGKNQAEKQSQQEPKQAQGTSAQSEGSYRSLFENSFDAILLATPDGAILAANSAAQQMFGMTEDELKKAGRDAILVCDERAKRFLEEKHQSGRAKSELTYRRKDGSSFEAEVAASFFTYADGIVKISMIIRDITERKKAEQELNATKERLEHELSGLSKLHEMSMRLVSQQDMKGLFDQFLNAAIELTHADMGSMQILDKDGTLRMVAHDGFKKPFLDVFNCVTGESHTACSHVKQTKKRIIVKDITKSPIFVGAPTFQVIVDAGIKAIQATPLTTRSGELIGIISTHYRKPHVPDRSDLRFLDLLARQAADLVERMDHKQKLDEHAKSLERLVEERTRELALERQHFFNMLEDLPVMVCLLTKDYHVAFANRLFREKFGESKGRCCYEYVGCVNEPCAQCESLVPLKTGKPHHWTAIFSNGMYVDAHDYPFTDVDGTKMVLEADVDITEKVNLQKQLQEKERLAAIGQTAGMVGHDLRNPLQSIIGEVFLAKAGLQAVPDSEHKASVQESIQAIAEQISYMDKIVSDLQSFVKPVEAHKQEVQLKPLMDSLLAQINIPANIQTSLQVDDGLAVVADLQLLKRVLINLITNAAQAMPQGGELTVKAQYGAKGGVQIAVQDTGTGISEQIKPKIFTPLFTTKSKGQGFGLAVCKRVIEAQGGTISFESQEGKGTKFTVELPIK
jgi:PAS domain S-box-containing protein